MNGGRAAGLGLQSGVACAPIVDTVRIARIFAVGFALHRPSTPATLNHQINKVPLQLQEFTHMLVQHKYNLVQRETDP